MDAEPAYRRKARLGVKFVIKKDALLVGFREKQSNFLADIQSCTVLDVRIGQELMADWLADRFGIDQRALLKTSTNPMI